MIISSHCSCCWCGCWCPCCVDDSVLKVEEDQRRRRRRRRVGKKHDQSGKRWMETSRRIGIGAIVRIHNQPWENGQSKKRRKVKTNAPRVHKSGQIWMLRLDCSCSNGKRCWKVGSGTSQRTTHTQMIGKRASFFTFASCVKMIQKSFLLPFTYFFSSSYTKRMHSKEIPFRSSSDQNERLAVKPYTHTHTHTNGKI